MGKFCQSCNCTAETNFTRKINCQCSVPRSRERQIIYDSPYHKQLVTAETTLFGNNFAHTGDKGTAWTRLVPPLGHWFSIWGVPQDRFLTACRLLTFQPRQPLSLFFFFLLLWSPGREARSRLCCVFWLLCTARTVKFVFPQDDLCANCNTCVRVNFQPNEIGFPWLLPTSYHPISAVIILRIHSKFAD